MKRDIQVWLGTLRPRCVVAVRTALSAALLTAGFGVAFGNAHAALGARAESVEADRQKLNAPTSKVARRALFSVHEIAADTGATVREFVRDDGTVFAVAWDGPVKPDLQQILGTYFSVYVSASSKQKSRGLHQVEQEALVVQSAGRVRSFRGFAYVPSLMPAGVTQEDLK